MASQTTERTTHADRISFEVERVAVDKSGRLVVSGRWFGIRGRRFVRPTLVATLRPDRSERRALADLEHKPWAAEDGEFWQAAFPLDIPLEDADELELSVAPDIAVELAHVHAGRGSRNAARHATREAHAPRSRSRSDQVPARPGSSDQRYEIERLNRRLAGAEREAEREHARRDDADQALEAERSQALKLRAELGRLRAELELAAATRKELATASAELDATRTEARDTGSRLQATIRALDQQRAESERLRMRLTAAEATIERLTRAHETARRDAHEQPARQEPADDETTRPLPVTTAFSRGRIDQPSGRFEPGAYRTSPATRADYGHSRHERPVDHARRPHTDWFGRALAVLVIIGVIVAIVLVINSTVA